MCLSSFSIFGLAAAPQAWRLSSCPLIEVALLMVQRGNRDIMATPSLSEPLLDRSDNATPPRRKRPRLFVNPWVTFTACCGMQLCTGGLLIHIGGW